MTVRRKVRHSLRATRRRQEFAPGPLALPWHPFYFARKGLHRHLTDLAPRLTGNVLDVGCGQKPYEYLCGAQSYVGMEIDDPHNRRYSRADIFYDGGAFPFSSEKFDGLLVSQVLEHVFTPQDFLAELNRVLKPGGLLLLTVPFVWDEHHQPHDYARYSSFGVADLLQTHGFEILDHRKSMSDIRAVLQMLNCYIHKEVTSKSRYIRVLAYFTLMGPINLLGEGLAKILPENEDLYLDNVLLARKAAGGP